VVSVILVGVLLLPCNVKLIEWILKGLIWTRSNIQAEIAVIDID
jgi:hypothetical protein